MKVDSGFQLLVQGPVYQSAGINRLKTTVISCFVLFCFFSSPSLLVSSHFLLPSFFFLFLLFFPFFGFLRVSRRHRTLRDQFEQN